MSRTMDVLRAVVDEYVSTCAPVGSQTIFGTHGLSVSAATIRGDLSKLEFTGHLTHPHVSAGRIPTELGYRTVVDDELARGAVRAPLYPVIHATSVSDAMRSIAEALAAMTSCLAIVANPTSACATVSRIDLVPTLSEAAVLVVVCDDGRVDSRTVSTRGLSAGDITEAEQLLGELFVGRELTEVEAQATRIETGAPEFVARLARAVRSSVVRSRDSSRSSAGLRLLLSQPEFRDVGSSDAVELVGALEDDDIDFDRMLTGDADGLVVRIGSENPDGRLHGLSFVAKEFWSGSGMGFVACVGPTRMDYRSTIGAVSAASARAADAYRELA